MRILTKNAALTYAKDGVRVNSIHPGAIRTPMTEEIAKDPKILESWGESVPVGRIGIPNDIAYGALFLASDESSYMTGSELVIDGGVLAQ